MSNNVSGPSAAALEAITRIEEQARARYRAELVAENIKPAPKPVEMVTEAAEPTTAPAVSSAPRAHIAALRGDLKKVTKVYADKATVSGPSAESMARGAQREAQLQLDRIAAAEAEQEAKASFTPEKLRADLQAKERVITRLEKKLNQALKRIEALEVKDNG